MNKCRIAILSLLIILMLVVGAIAEEIDISNLTVEQLNDLKDKIDLRIAELGSAESDNSSEEEGSETQEGYTALQKGDKSDEVKKLQQRLIELNYLSGGADGDYGNKTANAVSAFQKAAGLEQTGVADAQTQEALYASDAPVQKVYQKLDYSKIARDPDLYKGEAYQFTGKVLQVMEDDSLADSFGVYTVLRVASKGRYDDVVYVTYWRPKGASRILEDDKVTVYGVSDGLYTYESTSGKSVTIPLMEADIIE